MKRNNPQVTQKSIDPAERRKLLASAYRILILAAKRKSKLQDASFECVAGEVTNLVVAGIEHGDQMELQKGDAT